MEYPEGRLHEEISTLIRRGRRRKRLVPTKKLVWSLVFLVCLVAAIVVGIYVGGNYPETFRRGSTIEPQSYEQEVRYGASSSTPAATARALLGIEPTPSPTPNPTSTPEPTSTPRPERGNSEWIASLEREIHEATNEERRKVSRIGSLVLDTGISRIARSHSEDMAKNNFFEHTNPRGQDPSDRGSAAGYECRKDYGSYYTYGLGENIYQTWMYDSYTTMYGVLASYDYMSVEELASQVVQGWMGSPGHRENILEGSYDREGIGVAVTEDQKVYVTQNFC